MRLSNTISFRKHTQATRVFKHGISLYQSPKIKTFVRTLVSVRIFQSGRLLVSSNEYSNRFAFENRSHNDARALGRDKV